MVLQSRMSQTACPRVQGATLENVRCSARFVRQARTGSGFIPKQGFGTAKPLLRLGGAHSICEGTHSNICWKSSDSRPLQAANKKHGVAVQAVAAAEVVADSVDQSIAPRVAALKVSKTMALTDAANAMKEAGIPVIGLAAGEPDFDTPEPIAEV